MSKRSGLNRRHALRAPELMTPARAGRIIRIDSSRCAKNHTALLSSSSTVSQATATPSRMRSSRHWAARVLLPYPDGTLMRIRRRRPAARKTSASRSRATSDLSTTGGRYFVTGEGGVGVADVGRLSFRRAPRRGRFTASVLLPYPAHQGERGYRPLADPQPRRGGRLISACRPQRRNIPQPHWRSTLPSRSPGRPAADAFPLPITVDRIR